jgi:hypothetical protein
MAGAVVAHLIAGGFSVSMAPERTLVFVLTGCLLGARDASATTVQESRHAAQESSRAAPDAGLLFGTACCALIPFYAYHAFTWGDASRPVYAAVAVPVILWVVAAFLRRGPFVPFAVNAAGAIIGGLAILTTCVLVNGRDFERDPSRNAAMGAATPLLLAWIVGVFAWVALRRGAQRGTRVDTLDTASASAVKPGRGPSWRAPVGSALAAACALLAFWIATAEMRSDTVMLGAVQLNMRARRLDEWLTLHETDPTKREAGRAQAIEINEQALELVERAKAVGAPLRRFGCLAPIERVLESERP